MDGQVFQGSFSAVWPKGSKHVLNADAVIPAPNSKSRYTFKSWIAPGVELPSTNMVTITADPSTLNFTAKFETAYALTVSWFGCNDPANCPTSGTIYEGGSPHLTDFETYYDAGAQVKLSAVPSAGYVFAGWVPLPNQSISGMFNTITMNEPVVAHPMFQVGQSH